MKQVWFKKWGWFYLPITAMGMIITLFVIAFMVPIVMAIDRNAHATADEMYQIFVYASCTAFWWKWVVEKTS